MSIDELRTLRDRLSQHLTEYDWEAVEVDVDAIASLCRKDPGSLDDQAAEDVLMALRESRCFRAILRLSAAMEEARTPSATVRRLTAQAFIDTGRFPEAQYLLEKLVADGGTPAMEQRKALGLLGRLHKQAYVDVEKRFGIGRPQDMELAVDYYRRAFGADPRECMWPGINLVALEYHRGNEQESAKIAQEVLVALDQASNRSSVWAHATRLQAYLALKKYDEAEREAWECTRSKDVSAFALSGTRRQLEELWGLDDKSEPGVRLLPLLAAALLRKTVGVLRLQGAGNAPDAQGYEKKFGIDASKSMAWLAKAFERCKAVARIEKAGKGVGTGWLVQASDFFKDYPTGDRLLLTNAHVVATPEVRSTRPVNAPFLPEEVQINFMSIEKPEIVRIAKIEKCFPIRELDATFLVLDRIPDGTGFVPLAKSWAPKIGSPASGPSESGPRMYVIGHPAGRSAEIALHDNHLIASNKIKLHYRSPTEEGSSGSPVFEENNWDAVALHHSGKERMAGLDDPNVTYQANEGICLEAIQNALR
jgi:tetratricopeptide (TPR) repeat protein